MLIDVIKIMLGYIRGHLAGVKNTRGVYIGKHCNIKNGKTIKLGRNVTIRSYVDIFSGKEGIEIGNSSEIGQRCRLSISNSLVIGDDVLLSPNVYITDCDHKYEDVNIPVIKQGIVEKENRVIIGDGSYIGINSVIIGNISIGKHSIIGANSVVTRDIPDCCVAAGNPE